MPTAIRGLASLVDAARHVYGAVLSALDEVFPPVEPPRVLHTTIDLTWQPSAVTAFVYRV